MSRKDPAKAEKVREYKRKWDNHWRTNIENYHAMTHFIMGEQWEEKEARLFEDYKKVPLTDNRLAPQMNHLLGEQRQNTPNLQIDPSDDVKEQAADVRAALIKDISLSSHAKVIYQNAFEQACIGGFSAFCSGTDYDGDDTFLQHITKFGFTDPTKCFWDIGAQSPCKTDGMQSGFSTIYTRNRFRSLWGAKLEKQIGSSTTDISDEDDIMMTLSDETTITVLDVYERISTKDTLYELSNGQTLRSAQFSNLEKVKIDGKMMLVQNGEPVTVNRKRDLTIYSIKHSKWAGDFELENTDFPSKQLPLIYVDQHSYRDKKGKQITRSFFKDAKDSQRFLNYIRTQIAYLIKISRYDQFMASKQNVRGADTLQAWRDPQTVKGAIFYDESPNGNKPEQLRPPEISQSLIVLAEGAANSIQATTGMFDSQMGEQGNEISKIAIDARTKAGNYNTYLPFDSLNRAIAVDGEITDEMIPNVYDTERTVSLEMKDTGRRKVTLNKPRDDYGLETENDMTKGSFKIRLVPGASQESQKTENLQSMDMVLSKQPDAFNAISDLYVENLPMANSIEMRNRLRATIDPAIIEAGKTGQPLPPKPPQQDPMVLLKQQELQQKMMQAQMDAQAKAHELQLKEQEIIMKSHQAGVDYSSKLQELKLKEQENEASLHERMLRYQAEMSRISADIHLGHADNMQRILTHQPNHFKADNKPMKTEKSE